ncbi:MAG: hypothetical protein IJQ18_07125 [Paludibacteraceae bacterium]|nr:hypothetical protein [Paludibacteraceae bacterium]
MKKIFTTVIMACVLAISATAVTVSDASGVYKGTLNIGGDVYPNEEVYILPGVTVNTITFVLPNFKFGAASLGDIVLVNIPMNGSGQLSLDNSPLYIKAINERAVVSVLNGIKDGNTTYNSIVSASSAQVLLSIVAPSLPEPIMVLFTGNKVTDKNYAITNGDFEGNWSNNEPQGWHGFNTVTGNSILVSQAKNAEQLTQSNEKRPGSTGSHSALIKTKSIYGNNANGNCTNGQINAGSTTATDASGNYNFSDPNNNGYNTAFVGQPDSLVFWAKYIPADQNPNNSVNKARAHAVITTNARYQDPESSDYSSVKIADAGINYSATSSMGWQRLSVPFTYTSVDPSRAAYMLITFTTNMTPAGGSAYTKGGGLFGGGTFYPDNVYLDDAEMIYNHSLTSLKMNGNTVSFSNGRATTNQIFSDSEYTFAATTNGKAAKSFIGFDAEHNQVLVYVVADSYSQAKAYSVYTLQMAEPVRDTEYAYSATTCANEPYSDELFTNLTEAKTYTTRIPNTKGGDSIITLTLNVLPVYAFPVEEATIKMNESYVWREKTYQGLVPGVYTFADSLLTKAGCDSVYTLTLTVEAIPYLIEESMSACQNEEAEWRLKTPPTATAGTFVLYDSLVSKYGTDSVYKLTLTVHPVYTFPEEATMKMNGSYEWREKTYQNLTPGVYTFADSLQTKAGCDSVYTLTLNVQSIGYWYEESLSACVNEEAEWHSQVLPTVAEGTFVLYDSLQSIYGMDSVYKLTLTVHPIYLFTEEKYVNEANLEWRGKTIQDLPKREEPYLIYDSLTTQYGCDSVYLLRLHVSDIPITYGSFSAECCGGEFILFDGVEYRESFDGEVRVSEKNIYGGDSIVHVIITVFPSYFIEEELTIVVGEETQWEYYNLSQMPLGSATLKAEYWSDDFCDSIRVLHLTVIPKPIGTGIPNTGSEKRAARKVLYNGKLYIIRKDEHIYDVLGNKIQ